MTVAKTPGAAKPTATELGVAETEADEVQALADKPEWKVRAKVCVVYTGGTIGMVHDEKTPGRPLTPADEESLKKNVPGLDEALAKVGIQFQIVRLKDAGGKEIEPLDSSDVKKDHWVAIARAIEANYDEFDGFVILHGTDTMAYTCSALSFVLHNLAKPVVVTGSQLPIVEARTDGVLNFINALYIAGYKATGLPLIPEVVLAFADGVFRGNRLTKVSTERFQGFDSPNYGRIGELGERIKIDESRVRPAATEPFYVDRSLEGTDVVVLTLYPGFRADLLKEVAGIEDVKGLVLRTFGAGNAPTEVGSPGLVKEIAKVVKKGIHVVNVTQCIQGKVEAGLYAAGSGLLDAGVLSGLDMTEEAALTKLMWLLGTEADERQIPIQMQINLRGEQSESLFEVRLEGKRPGPPTTVFGTPPALFRKAKLKTATLRVSGFKTDGIQGGHSFGLKIFLNMPNASYNDSDNDPHFVCELHPVYQGSSNGLRFVEDITETVRRISDDGRAISVSFTLEEGQAVSFTEDGGVSLSLFCAD